MFEMLSWVDWLIIFWIFCSTATTIGYLVLVKRQIKRIDDQEKRVQKLKLLKKDRE